MDIKVIDITLLSKEEAEKLPKEVLEFYNWWWLRSPGIYQDHVSCISSNGLVRHYGCYVKSTEICVRPALVCKNLESLNLKNFEKIEFCGVSWVKISDNMLLCDDNTFGHGRFDSKKKWDWEDTKYTYENSEIYKYIHEKWDEIIHSTIDNINVQDITLLSKEEAEKLPEDVLKFHNWWWLRSPHSTIQNYAIYVRSRGSVHYGGDSVDNEEGAIRPVLICKNLESFKDFEEIEFRGVKWVKISDNMLLCNDETFEYGCFDFSRYWNWNDPKYTYETSDIYKYIHEKWDSLCSNEKEIADINEDVEVLKEGVDFWHSEFENMKKDRDELLIKLNANRLTDTEYRIFLAAMSRELQICKSIDEEVSGEVSLIEVCNSIKNKIKGALRYETK